MPKPSQLRLSFQAKVLAPVLAFLILVPLATSIIVHLRVTTQFEQESNRKLQNAEKMFGNSREIRNRFLRARYRNVVQDPRFKAVAQLLANKPDSKEQAVATLLGIFRDFLLEAAEEQSGVNQEKIFMFTTAEGESYPYTIDPEFRAIEGDFEKAAHELIEHAFNQEIGSDLVVVNDHLLTVISIPVRLQDLTLGAFTVGVPLDRSTAVEFASQTGAEIALIAGNKIIGTTLAVRDAQRALEPILNNLTAPDARQISIGNEHYRALSGSIPALPKGAHFGYVVLASYEQARHELIQTQTTLWLISLAAIVISGSVVWLIIGRVTEPLRRLRDSAEAVGHGDFSKRLDIATQDEIGALAQTFNQMTENLQTSRAELEKTFETLKSTQNQLIQREKLSAVGEFVAGVAHELNNPLTSLIGFAELLQQSGVSEQQSTHLKFIVKSSQRCHKIVQNLLSFARQHPPERKLVRVGELLDSVLELLAYEMRTSNIEVFTKYDSTLPKIIGDSHQLQQVILNILNNARQAIEANQPHGQIRITTERAAHMIRITIADNGPGISKENLAKVFDPFFTTKPVGQGTGLGLSLCYGIIKEHNGSIAVASEPGQGATFVIEIPAASALAIAAVGDTEGELATSLNAAGKRILVIDDEEWILTLTRNVLEEDGYKVDVAVDGYAALNAIEDTEYDLLVCDQKMPGLSGTQLYQRLLDEHPKVADRLIFMTGDVVGENFQQFLKDTRKPCLTKPFSLRDLRKTVAELTEKN